MYMYASDVIYSVTLYNVLLYNASAFQVTEMALNFLGDFKLYFFFVCVRNATVSSCSGAHESLLNMRAGLLFEINLLPQQPSPNFPDSHHAQLVLPHSSTHIMHHNARRASSVCTPRTAVDLWGEPPWKEPHCKMHPV